MSRRMPIIQQSEASECGIACLAMVAGYYGHRIDLASMRRRHEASIRGLTLQNIIVLARSFHLLTRALRVDQADLRDLRCPAILHWNMSHFVVLKRVTRKGIIIHDPADGARLVSPPEIDRCFTGIVLELTPTEAFTRRNESDPVTIRELLKGIDGLVPRLSQTLLLASVAEAVTLCTPLIVQRVVDRILVERHGNLSLAVAGLMLFGLFEVWSAAARDLSTINVGNQLSVSWQTHILDHMMKLPIGFFEKRSSGDIISRFDAADVVRSTVTGTLTNVIFSGLVSVITLLAMYAYSKSLSYVVVVGAILFVAIRHVSLPWLRERARSQASHDSKVRSHLMETLYGIRPLKLFEQEAPRASRWLNHVVEATNARSRVENLKISINAATATTLRVEAAILLGMGAVGVTHGSLSIGALFAFLAYKDHFNANVMGLINNLYDVGALSVQLDRISDIVRETPEVVSTLLCEATDSAEALEPLSIEMEVGLV